MGFMGGQEAPVLVVEERSYTVPPSGGYYELQPYPRVRRRGGLWLSLTGSFFIFIFIIIMLLSVCAGFLLWPSQPVVELKRWKLDGITIDQRHDGKSIFPVVDFNVTLDVLLEIKNRNFAGVEYDYWRTRILYRDSEVGDVKLKGGSIRARSVVRVPAVINLETRQILENASELWMDYVNRRLPLTTRIQFIGALQFFFLKPHVEVNLSCDVVVDPKDKVILKEECGLDF
ncbi:unnamed protein product [Sphagnum troendelagicum]|uniref:Late embryogenesis abundant protein LEA-2 subgroup domain-containing protein n=1 Tax=Sphagnum troendelagicum TaxID=128251 RepID=A0ABP0UM44_9BRYO